MVMRDTRLLDVPRLLYALVEVVRQLTGRPLAGVRLWRPDEVEAVTATAKAAAALADLQVDIGRRHASGVDQAVADEWRSAVQHLRAAATELTSVGEALKRPG